MKIIFASILFLVLGKSCVSQLHFKNQSNTDINLCVGYYWESDGFSGWITEGWFNLRSKETICIYCKPLINRYYYYFGYTADSVRKEYSGDVSLLVKSEPFKILNADKQSAILNDKFFFKRFRKVDTQNSSLFTVTLGGKKSVQTPVKQEPVIEQDTITTKSTRVE